MANDMDIQKLRWQVSGTNGEWKIVTEDDIIDEDDNKKKELIATIYEKENAKYIVDLHNLSLAVRRNIDIKIEKKEKKNAIHKSRPERKYRHRN